jgi:four helix bundle protein
MNKFKELKVWQKSVDLAVDVYALTSSFPDKEKFGLTSQVNRCAVSIASNIAEGAGRNSTKEFDHFLAISIGSSFELETQLTIANRIGFTKETEHLAITTKINEVQNMTFGLKKSLKSTKNV